MAERRSNKSAGTGTFLDEIALGRFIDGDSPLHRAQTIWKAVVFTLFGAGAFFLHSASAFLLLGLTVALVSWRAGLPQLLFWRSLRPVNLLAVFTLIASALWSAPDSSFLHPAFSWQGLHAGGIYAARLVLITLLTTLFFLTTRPAEAIRFGILLLTPLRFLGIQRQELSLLVHLAYRFVPLLRREIQELAAGRLARNLPAPKGPLAKAGQAKEALVFLFVGALHRAEITGLALEQRRVVETWNDALTTEHPAGLGGWMSLMFILSCALAVWRDPFLL